MPVIPLLRIKFYTMYQKAQDNFILGFCHHWKEKYDWQDTHFVIHLEVSSKRITKNLVCMFHCAIEGKWLIVAELPLWYNLQRCRTQSGNRKGVSTWHIISFLSYCHYNICQKPFQAFPTFTICILLASIVYFLLFFEAILEGMGYFPWF